MIFVFIEQFAFPGSFARSLPAFRLIRLLRLLRTLRYLKSSPQLMAFISNAWRIGKTLGSWAYTGPSRPVPEDGSAFACS